MTTAPDMTASIEPRSDQINAEDLLTGPRTVTITGVTRGSSEQPVNFVTEEFGTGRPYKPSKTMRRVIVAAWGTDTKSYVGRRITIYRDPDIRFGPDKVGGIRISHLSHIGKRMEIVLMVSRGRRSSFTVEPLPDVPGPIDQAAVTEFERRIAAAASPRELDAVARDLKARDLGQHHGHLLAAFKDRQTAITEPPPPDESVAPPPEMASRQQITQLKKIRQAEKYHDDADWFDYVHNVTGARVTADDQLTADQAQRIIDLFNN